MQLTLLDGYRGGYRCSTIAATASPDVLLQPAHLGGISPSRNEEPSLNGKMLWRNLD